MAQVVAKADVVITTAQVQGAKAPMLVTETMVEGMAPGSVVVDLAAEQGGNVEPSVAGRGGAGERRDRHRPGQHQLRRGPPLQPRLRQERPELPAR